MPLTSINPTTREVLATYEEDTEVKIERKLALAECSFPAFRRLSFAERGEWMERAAEILESGQDHFGRLMTLEMGKTLVSARAEAAKCAAACRYYAANAERLLADEAVDTSPARSYVRYQPLGPVLAIMPWNFPFWQVFRFAAPALMAGNVGLLKHASNVPQCALAIEGIFREAGFPEGAFQTLLIGSGQTARVIGDERVKAVTLTGSEPAGSQVAAQAGKLIKKTLLELGGSDPFIVMPSADLDAAVKTAVNARTINNGQSCIAAKRFLVAAPVADQFERRFVAAMEALRPGDPLEETTALGPLATPAILEGLERQVKESVAAGARVLTGGRRLDRPGNFYAPTVLAGIPETAPAYREEMFGPVAQLYRFDTIDEAIRIANATPFGLGASVWTHDEAERARFIDEIEAGMVYVNAMVASDPRLPFGGVKHSGYGRELGANGIREFVNVKTVWIGASARGHRHHAQ
ncbi:MAG TPA: NAD-dependent succinate-semialdehyde dehydrogenase [Bryobacteraceae bacterium]|nr:NAD-dependent succinate-semialdehyde dehydrogenase [Bryobacteraceae bacterium]